MYAYVGIDRRKKKFFSLEIHRVEKSIYKFENSEYLILSSEINPIIKFTNDKKLTKRL